MAQVKSKHKLGSNPLESKGPNKPEARQMVIPREFLRQPEGKSTKIKKIPDFFPAVLPWMMGASLKVTMVTNRRHSMFVD